MLQHWFIYGNYIDEVLRMTDSDANDYYYVHDHLYSPAALIAADGNVVERYEYDAYGKATIRDSQYAIRNTSLYNNPYLFTGRRVDILNTCSLKIQYSRNRYYDYYTGRWLSHDPLGITPNTTKPNRFEVISQYKDGMSLYEYVGGNPIAKKDPLGLVNPSHAFCHFLFLGWDIDIDEETNPDAEILHEVRNLASIRDYVEYLKNRARQAMVNLGKKMKCPSSSEVWPYDALSEVHLVPIWKIGLRLTLQQFTVQGSVLCEFQKRCCSEHCSDLPIAPCGLVMGKCKARMHVHDKYDFYFLNPLGWLGEPYDIDIYWKEIFTVGPMILCGPEKVCDKR